MKLKEIPLWYRALLNRQLLRSLKCCVLFVGPCRSGHTLIAEFLNAHPNMHFARKEHPVDNVHRLNTGMLWQKVLDYRDPLMLKKDWRYRVPGQHQGEFADLQVLGSRGCRITVKALAENPERCDQLEARIPAPIKFLHMVRNPFENIAKIVRYNQLEPEDAADLYFKLCDYVDVVRKRFGSESLREIYLEDLIDDPRGTLLNLLAFLGMEAQDDYLDACAGMVWKKPSQDHKQLAFDAALDARINKEMAERPYLKRYLEL